MRHRTIAEGVVVLLVSASTLIQPAQGDGPKTTMYQRLCEQAVKTMQSRRTALVKGGDCLQRTIDRLFGWEWDVVAAAYPAEVLLYDQVLETLIQDAVAGAEGFQPLAKTPESLIVHLTYGADCEMPVQALLHGTDQAGARAEMSPLLYMPHDCCIRQADLGIKRTRADVYATVRVRERASQREGKLFLFLSLSLAESKPGSFQWDRVAKTQRFNSGSEKLAGQLSASSAQSR